MTTVLIILAALVANVPLAMLVAKVIHKEQPRSTISLGAATLNPAAEGTGAHPGSAGHDAPPCVAVPPQGVPRPNPYVGHEVTVRDGQPFVMGGGKSLDAQTRRRLAEQVESTGYYGEKLS